MLTRPSLASSVPSQHGAAGFQSDQQNLALEVAGDRMIGVGRRGSVQDHEIKHFDGRQFIGAWTGSPLVPFGHLTRDNDSTAPMSDWGQSQTTQADLRWSATAPTADLA